MKSYVLKEVNLISLEEFLKNNSLEDYKGKYAYIRNMRLIEGENSPEIEDKYFSNFFMQNSCGPCFREMPFESFIKLLNDHGLEWCIKDQGFHLTDYESNIS